MGFDIEGYAESRLNRFRRCGGRSGNEATALCPRCDKVSKFYLNLETGSFVCFSCDFRGRSIVWLVAEVEGFTTAEARAFIFRQTVAIRRRDSRAVLRDRIAALRPHTIKDDSPEPEDFDLPKSFRPVWKDGRWDFPIWLKEKRGIKSKTARAWGLGYCRFGKYAGRLIIPIECPNGRSFTARDMTDEQEPKYLNPWGADHRRLLIGWGLVPLVSDLVICEGPLDAVKLWQHRIPALALGGKELHDEQIQLLRTLSQSQAITIMLDPEEREAPYRLAESLHTEFDSIFIATLPDGTDPGDSTFDQAHTALDDAVQWKGDRTPRLLAKVRSAGDAVSSRR